MFRVSIHVVFVVDQSSAAAPDLLDFENSIPKFVEEFLKCEKGCFFTSSVVTVSQQIGVCVSSERIRDSCLETVVDCITREEHCSESSDGYPRGMDLNFLGSLPSKSPWNNTLTLYSKRSQTGIAVSYLSPRWMGFLEQQLLSVVNTPQVVLPT